MDFKRRLKANTSKVFGVLDSKSVAIIDENLQKLFRSPFYRTSDFNSALLFLTFVFPVALWAVIAMLLTGGVYDKDKNGELIPWSKSNKIIAWIIFLAEILLIFFLVLPEFF